MSGRSGSDTRWSGRPRLSRAVRLLANVGPLVLAVGLAYLLGAALPDPTSFGEAFGRWVLLSSVSTVLLLGLDRLSRRLMPFAALLQLNLVFPDRAPSRYKIARSSASTRQLADEVAMAREHGLSDDRTLAAESVLRLVAALSLHDKATRGHAERTRVFTDMIAEELDLAEEDVDRLRWASLVHDVGKIAVHPGILNKPGKPTDEEWHLLRQHPIEGARLTAPLREWLGEWSLTIEQHHEQWDGTGYPHGLAGREIGLGARIVAVADAYDVMTARRAYRDPLPPHEARQELADCAGTQFDPVVVRAFLAVPLNRLRAVVGPLSWVAHLPVMRPLARIPSTVGAVTAVATTAAGVVLLGGIADLPVADEPVIAGEVVVAPSAEPLPNRGPRAGAVAVSTTQDTPVEIDVVGAAADPDGDPVAVSSVAADRGDARITRSGRVVFTPEPGYTGQAGLRYVLTDGQLPTSATARVTVLPRVNTPPTLTEDTATFDEDTSVTLDVLANDTDPDGDELSIVSMGTRNLQLGSVVDNGNGTITYTPRRNVHGTDVLAYRVTDGTDDTQRSKIRFVIRPVADNPTASNDSYTAEDGGRLDVSADEGLLANDRDADGDALSVELDTLQRPPTSHGTVDMDPDGSFRFTPRDGYAGTTGFGYVVTDGDRRAGASVTIVVERNPTSATQPEADAGITPESKPRGTGDDDDDDDDDDQGDSDWTDDGLFLTGSTINNTTSKMSASRPAGGSIPDWDRDGQPGRSFRSSSQKEDEDDPEKYHDFLYTLTDDVRLDGKISLTITSAVEDLEGEEDVDYTVFVHSCNSSGRSCTRLAGVRDIHVDEWNPEGRYSTRTVNVGSVSRTLAKGSTLRVKVMFHHERVWLPLTGDRPTVLNVTARR